MKPINEFLIFYIIAHYSAGNITTDFFMKVRVGVGLGLCFFRELCEKKHQHSSRHQQAL
jgi:hypothetical protein